jgi:signal transduction histidine kinase
MITNSVKNQDPRSIDKMAASKTQFGDLAATIQGFFEQKEQLEKISSDMGNVNKELQKKDSVKDDFISMLSHQLGTPLSAMEGFLTLIVQGFYGEANEKIMAAVQKTLTRTKNMKALVFDLLNVSRMTAGQFVIERSEVNLNSMVKDQVDELSVAANEKNISLTYHEPEKPLPMMQLDEAKTRQVILNLVNNAIFYTPKNGEVHVYLSQTDTEVEFKVLDNGIGVPDEAKDKLFTKFFRADNAKEQSPHGTGIGLYLVKRVINDQDGKTFFSSEAGKGSIFGFRLPLSNDKNPVPSAHQEEKTTSDTKIDIKDLTTDSKE